MKLNKLTSSRSLFLTSAIYTPNSFSFLSRYQNCGCYAIRAVFLHDVRASRITMATCAIVDLIKIRTTQKQFSHYMSNPDVADKLGGYSKCHMVLCNLMATRIRSIETNKRWRWRRLHLVNLNSIRRFIQGKAILIDVNCRNFKSLVDNPLNRLYK